ncbi:hypothetical protein [Glycomyces arizonensis]|uniref:hypothetical protein n=1 Tax=Glycomyces arizonensis TaxID=256035 RepID=UPI0003F6347E|nr:hypothetical protein [Glycomyces arizonensis]
MLRFFKNRFTTTTDNTSDDNVAPPPAVAEATVDAFVDAVCGTDADPLTDLVARTRRCAELVTANPGAYAPARLAHTVAAVTASLAQMGDATAAYVAEHWSSLAGEYADPAAKHLWEAVKHTALTAGLMDVAAPVDPAPSVGHADPLIALKQAAEACRDAVCTSKGDPVASPAQVARAIAQTLAALAPVFLPVAGFAYHHIPGRGRTLPEQARIHLAEATGRWAPIAGLITHLPADPKPPTPPAAGAQGRPRKQANR